MLQRLLERYGGILRPCAGGWRESELVGACPAPADPRFPLQPVNTLSNLAYPLGGLALVLVKGGGDALVFLGASILLGIGSAAYHGWPTARTAALDHAGMYATMIAVVLGLTPLPAPLTAVAAGGGAWALRYRFRPNLNLMMGVFLVVGLAIRWDLAGLVALGLFALAMVAWQIDRRTAWLGVWGHGIWHVLTAAAFAVMLGG